MEISKKDLEILFDINRLAFDKYKQLIINNNEKYGLTSIDENDFKEKHFLDSISVLSLIEKELKSGTKIADIGAGAGFPSVPLLIIKNDLNFDLIESNRKKAEFLQLLLSSFNFNNAQVINTNVKEVKKKYDIIVFRAFSSLSHFFKVSKSVFNRYTKIFALKGKKSELEKEISVVKNEKIWKYISAIEIHPVTGFIWERNIVEITWEK